MKMMKIVSSMTDRSTDKTYDRNTCLNRHRHSDRNHTRNIDYDRNMAFESVVKITVSEFLAEIIGFMMIMISAFMYIRIIVIVILICSCLQNVLN